MNVRALRTLDEGNDLGEGFGHADGVAELLQMQPTFAGEDGTF